MSGHSLVQSVSAVSTTTSARTMQQVSAAANHPIKIRRVEVGFDGTSTTGPQVLVEIIKGSSSGTGTTATPVETNGDQPETVQTTGKKDFSAEPTYSGGTVFSQYVHPQGKYIWVPPDDDTARVAGGATFNVRVTVGTAVNYAGNIYLDE